MLVKEKIIDSIGETFGTITASEIVIKCWHKYPETFGLEGYKDKHPDSNKVLAYLMGKYGLEKQGFIRLVDSKVYQITDTGRKLWEKLNGIESSDNKNSNTIILNSEYNNLLIRLFNSIVFHKMDTAKNEITFNDACLFWGDDDLEIKLIEIENILMDSNSVLKDGRLVTLGDIKVLKNINSYLKSTFERLIK